MTRNRRVLLVVCVALATVVSAVASLNLAIPSLARDTGASLTELSWIIDAYALTFAALLLPGGALGDRWGRRRALLGGLALFGTASAAAMLVQDPAGLIAIRAVLGLAAAVVMPATLSTITATFDAEDRVKGVAMWAGVAGGSAVLGLLMSGLLLEVWSWQSVFALSVVLAAVSFTGTLVVVPESADPSRASRDGLGVLLSAAGLGLVVYSIIEAPVEGWGSARTLAGLAVGIAVLAGFVVWELRHRRPLIDPRYFRRGPFAAGTLSLTMQFFCFFGFIFIFLQYLQLVRGESALQAAVQLLPLPLGLIPAARLAPHLVKRLGATRLCATGLVVIALGLTWLSFVEPGTEYWRIAVALFPLGAGMGLAMTPATTAITDALPAAEQGVASAMNDLARELGGALGIAVLGSVANSTYRAELVLPGAPAPIEHAARESLAVATTLDGPIPTLAREAFTAGLADSLRLAAVVITLAAVAVVALLARRAPRPEAALPSAAVGAEE